MGIDPVTHNPRLDLLDLSSIINSTSSPHLNLSSLLGLQTLMNPELLGVLVASLLSSPSSSSNQENPEILLQKLQENQLRNAQILQNQNTPILQQPVVPQVPLPPASSYLDQTHPMPGNNMGNFSMVSPDMNGQTFQENLIPSSTSLVSPSIYGYGISDNITTDNSDNSSTFCSLNNGSINQNNSQNFGLDSVLSTPLSGSPLNSSTFINCGSTSATTEDERESFCSNLMKFEIPASLDFDDFM